MEWRLLESVHLGAGFDTGPGEHPKPWQLRLIRIFSIEIVLR